MSKGLGVGRYSKLWPPAIHLITRPQYFSALTKESQNRTLFYYYTLCLARSELAGCLAGLLSNEEKPNPRTFRCACMSLNDSIQPYECQCKHIMYLQHHQHLRRRLWLRHQHQHKHLHFQRHRHWHQYRHRHRHSIIIGSFMLEQTICYTWELEDHVGPAGK